MAGCPTAAEQRFRLNIFLTRRRKALGLTQAQVAERIECARTTLGRWEAGLEECGDFPAWAAALDVDLVPVPIM